MKTNDLAYEENINQVTWESAVGHLIGSWDLLDQILPERLATVLKNHQESIKSYIPTLIVGKINQMVQSNLFFMIESSFLNFSFVRDLYRTLLPEQQLIGSRSPQSLITTTVSLCC